MKKEESHLEKKFLNGTFIMLMGGFIAATSCGAALVMLFFTKHLVLGFLLVLLELASVLIAIRAGNSSENWFFGLIGERKVAIILDQMWHDNVRAVHDKKFGKNGNVDHIVIAPTGVWAIESKFIGGNIEYANGELTHDKHSFKKNPLHQAFAEARIVGKFLAANQLNIEVKPVLAFSDRFAKVRFGIEKKDNVHIIGPLGFRYLILNPTLPKVLEKDQIDRIFELLDAHS